SDVFGRALTLPRPIAGAFSSARELVCFCELAAFRFSVANSPIDKSQLFATSKHDCPKSILRTVARARAARSRRFAQRRGHITDAPIKLANAVHLLGLVARSPVRVQRATTAYHNAQRPRPAWH